METAVVDRGRLYLRPNAGLGTSDRAEWLALLDALRIAGDLGERDILLLGDALGVIDQAVNGARCASPDLRECRDRFEQGSRLFERLRLRHVKRSHNLAGIALGQLRQGRRACGPEQRERP